MRERVRISLSWMAAAATAVIGVAQVSGQQDLPRNNPRAAGRLGQGIPGGIAPPKAAGRGANFGANAPEWPYKVKFKMAGADQSALAGVYYPAKNGPLSPVILMVHERSQTSREFESGIDELKGKGLAESLQKQGYAVLLVDLRNRGGSRGTLRPSDLLLTAEQAEKADAKAKAMEEQRAKVFADSRAKGKGGPAPKSQPDPLAKAAAEAKAKSSQDPAKEWQAMAADLQSAYAFLLDRHNRGELNIGKLGVIAVGDGANLAVSWANVPGAAVANSGRLSDLAALILISPSPKVGEIDFERGLRSLSRRVPILLMAGSEDKTSAPVVEQGKPIVESHKSGRIELVEKSPLRGSGLVRFEAGVVPEITQFLENTVRFKTDDWEPRFNLNPVATTRGEIAKITPEDAAGADQPKAEEPKKVAPAPEKKAEEPKKSEEPKKPE